MDDLSKQLNDCNTGCVIGDKCINHLMYADDLVVFSPSSAGFQQLLAVCSDYGAGNDIQYNSKKSVVLICRTKEDKSLKFPDFKLAGNNLEVSDKVKYLGHFITDDMKDDDDIYRQCCKIYAQANILARKFSMCSDAVKISLFKAYCTPLYTAHLWVNYKKGSMKRIQVAYNDAMRILLKRPRWCSANDIFVSTRVNTLQAVVRNLMYKCICRINASVNGIIMGLSNIRLSTVRYQSEIWRHWHICLFLAK
ncbi:hypothetical protein UPYG_G00235880 [Umbra pygmaea]|uniref:Reverse transcriptase domain-containing protein n=1 Tax=Umbra pygmaea TaxID=75934 RepID=A0ABD0WEA6_UMBPY